MLEYILQDTKAEEAQAHEDERLAQHMYEDSMAGPATPLLLLGGGAGLRNGEMFQPFSPSVALLSAWQEKLAARVGVPKGVRGEMRRGDVLLHSRMVEPSF